MNLEDLAYILFDSKLEYEWLKEKVHRAEGNLMHLKEILAKALLEMEDSESAFNALIDKRKP